MLVEQFSLHTSNEFIDQFSRHRISKSCRIATTTTKKPLAAMKTELNLLIGTFDGWIDFVFVYHAYGDRRKPFTLTLIC